jgi:hypothetical protein
MAKKRIIHSSNLGKWRWVFLGRKRQSIFYNQAVSLEIIAGIFIKEKPFMNFV